MYEIEKALKVLGKKFGQANRRSNTLSNANNVNSAHIQEQTGLLRQMCTLGRSGAAIPAAKGGGIAAELHWDANSNKAHIEYWDNWDGKLLDNDWDGVMAHTKDSYGDMICEWASAGNLSTLNNAVNTVPNWLGGTVNGTLLNNADLLLLISEITG